MSNETLLREAARLAGRPLRQHEIDNINKACDPRSRANLEQRFIKVIRGAGYVNDALERICAEHIDAYMKNIPEFIKMLEEYEANQRADD